MNRLSKKQMYLNNFIINFVALPLIILIFEKCKLITVEQPTDLIVYSLIYAIFYLLLAFIINFINTGHYRKIFKFIVDNPNSLSIKIFGVLILLKVLHIGLASVLTYFLAMSYLTYKAIWVAIIVFLLIILCRVLFNFILYKISNLKKKEVAK